MQAVEDGSMGSVLSGFGMSPPFLFRLPPQTAQETVLVLATLTLGAFFVTGRAFSALLLIMLGLYGLLTTAKLYERSQYHIFRARKLRARLDELCPDAQLELLYKSAETEHQGRYPWLMKVRLNTIWLCFYTTLIIAGSALLLRSLL